MSELPPLSVGDELILRSLLGRGAKDSTAVVNRIGRKWGYATTHYNGTVKFDLRTGYDDPGQFSCSQRVLTPEMDAEETQRSEAIAALKTHGITLGHMARGISTETILRLVGVLDDGLSAHH